MLLLLFYCMFPQLTKDKHQPGGEFIGLPVFETAPSECSVGSTDPKCKSAEYIKIPEYTLPSGMSGTVSTPLKIPEYTALYTALL
jgi:hypothetical protein